MDVAAPDTAQNLLAQCGHFSIRMAETPQEIRLAQQLRYRVFGGELHHLPDGNGLDQDEFDGQFRHLLVREERSGKTVGTYRIQSGADAGDGRGFYSESEYRIAGLEKIRRELWEVGRSCVDPEFRSGAVIALLWAGIAALQKKEAFRYLMGCVSIPGSLTREAWQFYRYWKRHGGVSDLLCGVARSGFECPDGESLPQEDLLPQEVMTPLLKGYLRAGAKIAGEPVLDRAFGTVDFLILLDFGAMTDRYRRHFTGDK